MIEAGLWQSRKRKVESIHQWRERRACFGELVQWDTSDARLAGRARRALLSDRDDRRCDQPGAGPLCSARHRRGEHAVLWRWLERYGRPLAFYTDKAAMFEVAKHWPMSKTDGDPMQATQITRALAELGIERISAHSPQAKGRIERFFETAQDRLVKHYGWRACARWKLLTPIWKPNSCRIGNSDSQCRRQHTDAHRPLTELHDLAASLSHVETRTHYQRLHDSVHKASGIRLLEQYCGGDERTKAARRSTAGWHTGGALSGQVSGHCLLARDSDAHSASRQISPSAKITIAAAAAGGCGLPRHLIRRCGSAPDSNRNF